MRRIVLASLVIAPAVLMLGSTSVQLGVGIATDMDTEEAAVAMRLVPTTAIPRFTDPSTARITGHGSPTAASIVHVWGWRSWGGRAWGWRGGRRW